MAPSQPGITPESIQEITSRLDTANGHLASIAGSLGKAVTMLDHYRPAIDRAAKLAGSPAARIAGAVAGRRGRG